MNCDFKKSDFTPCYLEDGEMCLADKLGKPLCICVGCEKTKEYLDVIKLNEKTKQDNITEDELKEQCFKIGNKIKNDIPKGCGFALLIFGYSPNQIMTYMSTAQRKDMIKVLEEFRQILIKNEK